MLRFPLRYCCVLLVSGVFLVGWTVTTSLAFGQINLNKQFTIHRPSVGFEHGPRFGSILTIDGEFLLVAAHHDNYAHDDAGASYLFDLDGTFLTHYYSRRPDARDYFGWGGALSSEHQLVVLGALFDDTDGVDSGIAEIFDLDGNHIMELQNPGAEPEGDNFGHKALFLGNRILISATGDDTFGPNAGMIYVYDLGGNLIRRIPPPSDSLGTRWGEGLIAIDDATFLVSRGLDDTDGDNTGAAYILDLEGNVLHRFSNPTPIERDRFGVGFPSISPLQELFLIGQMNSRSVQEFEETAYIFHKDGDLLLTLPDPNPNYQNWYSRSLVSLNDELIVVSSIFDDAIGTDKGAVYLFNFQGELVETLVSPDQENGLYFGSGLAVSGDRLFVGEAGLWVNGVQGVGAVHVYELIYRPGDANWDGEVDLDDFALLKDNFGTGSHFREGNFDRTGTVDLNDFNILKEHFGTSAPSVPEPSTWLLAVAALAGMVLSRRRGAKNRSLLQTEAWQHYPHGH